MFVQTQEELGAHPKEPKREIEVCTSHLKRVVERLGEFGIVERLFFQCQFEDMPKLVNVVCSAPQLKGDEPGLHAKEYRNPVKVGWQWAFEFKLFLHGLEDDDSLVLANLAIERAEKSERIYDVQEESLTFCVSIQQRGDRHALASETLDELDKFLLPIAPFQQFERQLVIDFGPCEYFSHVSGFHFCMPHSRNVQLKLCALGFFVVRTSGATFVLHRVNSTSMLRHET